MERFQRCATTAKCAFQSQRCGSSSAKPSNHGSNDWKKNEKAPISGRGSFRNKRRDNLTKSTSTSLRRVCQIALEYRQRGWSVTPLKARSKDAFLLRWQKTLLTEDDLKREFPPETDRNLGVLLGAPSGGL